MTRHLRLTIFAAAVLTGLHGNVCLAASVSPTERASLTKAVDQLCSWSGMARRDDLRKIEHFAGDWVTYEAKTDLVVEGHQKTYVIRFDSRFRVKHFMPEGFNLSEISIGQDTLKNPRFRQMCIGAVTRFNKALGWKTVVGPYAQRVGTNYIVTFDTATADELKRGKFYDAYVSFLVTPKGTVFGGFWGA